MYLAFYQQLEFEGGEQSDICKNICKMSTSGQILESVDEKQARNSLFLP